MVGGNHWVHRLHFQGHIGAWVKCNTLVHDPDRTNSSLNDAYTEKRIVGIVWCVNHWVTANILWSDHLRSAATSWVHGAA